MAVTSPTCSDDSPPHALTLSDIQLDDINRYDIWDVRESAVRNEGLWKAAHEEYKSTVEYRSSIPLILHQIWIGTREPPCIWLDTWRIDFMKAHNATNNSNNKTDTTDSSVFSSPWVYKLWDNDSVRDLPMLNRDLFDNETQPQCQADLLRLEVLYEHGGVYVDADIVSTGRDLRNVVAQANMNGGFMITYEPDTKDKPYSVLGNSLIMATPKHPLVLMLMAYIRATYAQKRPFHGAEWVTGPLCYTKVLVHTGMEMYVPESKDFYPQFHYVPDPGAVDLSKVDAYCFQFGYTCSGLSQWVRDHNVCRNPHGCSYHGCSGKVEYELGRLLSFPNENNDDVDENDDVSDDNNIPKIIHQFAFADRDENGDDGGPAAKRPTRWTDTWEHSFCPRFGYAYELWTWPRLKRDIGQFHCANLYRLTKLDARAVQLLALEVLNKYGGHYVPLSTVYDGDSEPSHTLGSYSGTASCVVRKGQMFSSASGRAVRTIRFAYETETMPMSTHPSSVEQEDVTPSAVEVDEMSVGDELCAVAAFPSMSRFLGAGAVHIVAPPSSSSSSPNSGTTNPSVRSLFAWGYECQVPTTLHVDEAAMASWFGKSPQSDTQQQPDLGRRVYVTNAGVLRAERELRDEIPGVLHRFDNPDDCDDSSSTRVTDWDYIVLNAEWGTGVDQLETYALTCPFRAPQARYAGYIANNGQHARTLDEVLGLHGSGRVWVMSRKYAHDKEYALLMKMLRHTQAVCQATTHGGYNVPGGGGMDMMGLRSEVCNEGRLLKVFDGWNGDNRIVFELQVHVERSSQEGDDDEGMSTVSFRAWSRECHAVECECRFRTGGAGDEDRTTVEALRVYRDGSVVQDVCNVTV